MRTDISESSLPVYEALASRVRLRIIRLLAERPMNIKELAQATGLSSAIITMHVKKLEKANIIRSERVSAGGAVQKLCRLDTDSIEILFPPRSVLVKAHEFSMPVGHYSDFSIDPTCGLATTEKIIGYFDDPRYFLDPERVNCGILWFASGYVEYRIPNFLLGGQTPQALEISLELSSEAPGVNDDWPSDIVFYFNGIRLGQWLSPGDFGNVRGRYTPGWWSLGVGQYGLLKLLRIDGTGTYIDGEKVSDVTLSQIDVTKKQCQFRIEAPKNAEHPGGVTLFGSGFGNYDQDIVFRLYYV
jgi:predicted transcriptional regulator